MTARQKLQKIKNLYRALREVSQHPAFNLHPLPTLWRFFWLMLQRQFPRSQDLFELVRWEVKLEVPRSFAGETFRLFVYQEYGEPCLLILDRFLKPGCVFVDVGASIGVYTLVASRLVGMYGCVLAFEPESEAFTCLKKILLLTV